MPESIETRIARLFDLLQQLRDTRGHTARALAQHYGKCTRTIERDLDLIHKSGFALQHLGRQRGYRLDPDYRPQLQALNSEEILPFLIGAQVIGGRQTALAKIRQFVTNKAEKLLTQELPEHVLPRITLGAQWLNPIAKAIVERTQIIVHYCGAQDQESKPRHLEPSALLLKNDAWYLDAYEVKDKKHKTFRLTRISHIETTTITSQHPARPPEQADFHTWDLAPDPALQAVLRVGPKLASWLQENPVHPSQEVWPNGRITYKIRNRDAFLRWVIGLDDATLTAPAQLCIQLRQRIDELNRRYATH